MYQSPDAFVVSGWNGRQGQLDPNLIILEKARLTGHGCRRGTTVKGVTIIVARGGETSRQGNLVLDWGI